MADRDLRRCLVCGYFFIENVTYDDPHRCPRCGSDVYDADNDVVGHDGVAADFSIRE
jgi:predicted Zn-ribbon and HTH transcriptional regulator